MDRRQFLEARPLAASALPLSVGKRNHRRARALLPVPLARGDTVGLSSRHRPADEPEPATRRRCDGSARLQVKTHPLRRASWLSAGTDAERAGALNAMFSDSTVKAIICTRGGSGAARLLPLLTTP